MIVQAKASPPPVCITGMHRSGTSMIARLLQRCGLYLGAGGDLLPPAPDNPNGFWEHAEFVNINEALLNDLGGGWDYPPPLPDDWPDQPPVAELHSRARALVASFEGKGLWGWKDPRSSLTMPFWRRILPGLRVVLCLRNPHEVALSLRQRSRHSYALGMSLWQAYNRSVLDTVDPDACLITHYDAYFDDGRAELRRIRDFLGLPVSDEQIDADGVTERLRHNQSTLQQLIDSGVSTTIVELYTRMSEAAGRPVRAMAGKHASDEQAATGSPASPRRHQHIGRLDGSVVEAELLKRRLHALEAHVTAQQDLIATLEAKVREHSHP